METFGTAFKVDGTWYIRLLEGNGNLIRLQLASGCAESLRDGQAYKIDGYVSRNHLGCDDACVASSVEAIGSPSSGSN